MTETPTFPRVRRPAARALASARAVASWRRWLAGTGGRAGALRRLSSWLRALTAAPPSLLADEPLGILPALVAEAADGHGAAKTDRPARVASADRGGTAPRAGARRVHSADRRRRHTMPPAVILGQASAEVAPPRAAVSVRRPLPAATVPRHRRTRTHGPLADVADGRAAPALAELLGERAFRRIAAWALPEARSGAAAEASDPDAARKAAGVVLPSLAARAVFHAQWSGVLDGRPAPTELLWRLHERGRTGAADPRASSREPTRAEPPAISGHREHADGSLYEAEPANLNRPSLLSGEVSGNGSAGTAPVGGAEARTRTTPAFAPTPPIAPTPAGPRAEPLRALSVDAPAQGLGPPAEAASRLRLVASPGTAHAAELDALAANVKRILDEEARRHGIDV